MIRQNAFTLSEDLAGVSFIPGPILLYQWCACHVLLLDRRFVCEH